LERGWARKNKKPNPGGTRYGDCLAGVGDFTGHIFLGAGASGVLDRRRGGAGFVFFTGAQRGSSRGVWPQNLIVEEF